MLGKKLERAKNKRQILIRKSIFYAIVLLISIIIAIISVNRSMYYCHKLYSSINMDAYTLFFVISMISILCVIWFLGACISNKISLSHIEGEIDDILFRLSLPTDFCYDVELKTKSLNDIYLKQNIKKLCIRYVESIDAIEFKYKLKNKKYKGKVAIDFAQYLFDFEFFNDVEN